jgi:hypothetical protein
VVRRDGIIVLETDMGASDALSGLLDRIEAACDEGDPFAMAVVPRGEVPPPEHHRGRGGRLKQLRRLKAARPRISERCAGIAMLIDPDDRANAKRLRGAQKAFGCPVQAFATLEGARAWLKEQLDTHELPRRG